MEDLTIIDGVVAVVVVISALLAFSRGFVREVMAIAAWVVAAIVAYIFAPQAEPLMQEIPVINEFIAGNCELSIIGAFFLILALALIIVSLFTPLFSSIVQRSALGGIDQGFGFLFGVLRGVLLVAIAFFVYDQVVTGAEYTIVDESRSAEVFGQLTAQIQEQNPEEALGWLTRQYEALIANCNE